MKNQLFLKKMYVRDYENKVDTHTHTHSSQVEENKTVTAPVFWKTLVNILICLTTMKQSKPFVTDKQ